MSEKNKYRASSRAEKLEAFGRLLDVLDELRVKCPWDAKQTNESLRPNTIEEVYELSDALICGNSSDVCKELGDVLLHIAFYAKIGEEDGVFDIADVCNRLTDKLIFRHPHVFGDTSVQDSKEVEQNWEQIKLKEKGGNKTVLSGVPRGLPSIIKAYRVQEKVANVGFDWHERSDVWDKVYEELGELRTEVESNSDTETKEGELGDLLFSLINMGRLYGLDPDGGLERTNQKFIGRFNHVEARAKEEGKMLSRMTLEEMDAYYEEAKKLEKRPDNRMYIYNVTINAPSDIGKDILYYVRHRLLPLWSEREGWQNGRLLRIPGAEEDGMAIAIQFELPDIQAIECFDIDADGSIRRIRQAYGERVLFFPTLMEVIE